jgi:hypothetical protein
MVADCQDDELATRPGEMMRLTCGGSRPRRPARDRRAAAGADRMRVRGYSIRWAAVVVGALLAGGSHGKASEHESSHWRGTGLGVSPTTSRRDKRWQRQCEIATQWQPHPAIAVLSPRLHEEDGSSPNGAAIITLSSAAPVSPMRRRQHSIARSIFRSPTCRTYLHACTW